MNLFRLMFSFTHENSKQMHDRHKNGVNIEHAFRTWHLCNLVLRSPSLILHTTFFFSLFCSSPILCYSLPIAFNAVNCHLNFPNMWQTVHLDEMHFTIRLIANDYDDYTLHRKLMLFISQWKNKSLNWNAHLDRHQNKTKTNNRFTWPTSVGGYDKLFELNFIDEH